MIRRRLRRSEVARFFSQMPCCVVGPEACATARYWGLVLSELGNDARLMPAAYVISLRYGTLPSARYWTWVRVGIAAASVATGIASSAGGAV